MKRLPLLFVCLLLLVGCRVTDEAINTAKVAAAGNDRYTAIVVQILDGTVDAKNGPRVTQEDLRNTPGSVRILLNKLLGAMHVNRFAWHSVLFQLDEGADPETMNLAPVVIKIVATTPLAAPDKDKLDSHEPF